MRVLLLTAAVLTLLLLIGHEDQGYCRRRRRRTTTRPPPIDCRWSSWSLHSSDCGNSCEGTRTYTRYRSRPADNGGRDCEGPRQKTEPCPNSGCQNGGQWGGAYCNCMRGFSGSCCQRRMDSPLLPDILFRPGVTCPPLDAPSNGQISGDGMIPGDEVHFSCDPGYSLLGSSSATCQSDGSWSKNRPICQRSSCPALPVVQHGSMYGSMTIGSTMTFSCLDGYTLSGPSSITCTGAPNGQGVWSAQSPTCTAVQCPTLSPPHHGTISSVTEPSAGTWNSLHCDTSSSLVNQGPAYSVSCRTDATNFNADTFT
ncbi:E-selectin-like [Branchiostoma floridae]|uniref:E-selectin-like n=1 Tax=Branchiostoma floridae TaxID=7739 RepID=A0A9J7MQE9_BRAFL|nr:E-selectin-like [Branchiostoma floridae]